MSGNALGGSGRRFQPADVVLERFFLRMAGQDSPVVAESGTPVAGFQVAGSQLETQAGVFGCDREGVIHHLDSLLKVAGLEARPGKEGIVECANRGLGDDVLSQRNGFRVTLLQIESQAKLPLEFGVVGIFDVELAQHRFGLRVLGTLHMDHRNP